MLEGHTDDVYGALALSDGRLLSWSEDKTLRLWDGQSGASLAVLEGHTGRVNGALALSDGRLLSWSNDKTLRLWDGQSGGCQAVLAGHNDCVSGALGLSEGRLLSWSGEKTLRLWDGQSGACLDVVFEDQVAQQHPEWLHAQEEARNPGSVSDDFFVTTSARTAQLHHKTISSTLAVWNADSNSDARSLLPDGTVAVTQANGQVCILKLHHGNRRITLAEAEAILAEQRKKAGE